jgi:hypothetical protein
MALVRLALASSVVAAAAANGVSRSIQGGLGLGPCVGGGHEPIQVPFLGELAGLAEDDCT